MWSGAVRPGVHSARLSIALRQLLSGVQPLCSNSLHGLLSDGLYDVALCAADVVQTATRALDELPHGRRLRSVYRLPGDGISPGNEDEHLAAIGALHHVPPCLYAGVLLVQCLQSVLHSGELQPVLRPGKLQPVWNESWFVRIVWKRGMWNSPLFGQHGLFELQCDGPGNDRFRAGPCSKDLPGQLANGIDPYAEGGAEDRRAVEVASGAETLRSEQPLGGETDASGVTHSLDQYAVAAGTGRRRRGVASFARLTAPDQTGQHRPAAPASDLRRRAVFVDGLYDGLPRPSPSKKSSFPTSKKPRPLRL